MDCFDGFKLIDDESIDMILTDLPYGQTARNNGIRLFRLSHYGNSIKELLKSMVPLYYLQTECLLQI